MVRLATTLVVVAAVAGLAAVFGAVTLTLLITAGGLLIWWVNRRPPGTPPGPFGLPVLGYLPFLLMGNPVRKLNKLSKQYGPIFSFKLGKEFVVVIQDYANVKKTFIEQADIFSGRPETLVIGKVLPGDENSILVADGPLWREHRRFALSTFREFGMGKSSIEPATLEEIGQFMDHLKAKAGAPFGVKNLLSTSICNNVCIIAFGKKYSYSDPEFQYLNHLIARMFKLVTAISIKQVLPWVSSIPGLEKIHKTQETLAVAAKVDKFISDHITEHQKNYQPGNKDDYIDAYLTERSRRQETGDNAEMFSDVALAINLRVFFAAGTESTVNTLLWVMIYMMLHPDIQWKVQQEVDNVIGRERAPSMEDRINMPFTDAVILEVQRKVCVNAVNLPHSNHENVLLNGFQIPKRTTILTNIYAVHHDEKLFPDPHSFRPERFINKEGKVVRPEFFIPFSTGKRACPGEGLARTSLFLYFTSLMQNFTLTNPEDQILSTETNIFFSNFPPEFLVQAIPRE